MITRQGNVLIKLDNGEEVGFRFDNWVFRQTQIRTNSKGIIELLTRIGVDDANIDLEAFSILLQEAANEYYHNQKIDQKIDDRGVSDLIDAMGGLVSALMKISEGLETHIPKNSQPPQMVGEITP